MIAITGGGTGGHLAIAKALKEEFNNRGAKVVYVGSNYGQDKAWFEKDDGFYRKVFLESRGIVNKRGLSKILGLLQVAGNILRCARLLKNLQIDTVISVGGYSAAPLALAAIILRKKLYIHEQNAISGALNKICSPFAKAVFSSFDELSLAKDYPVSKICFELSRTREEVRCVIFLGGSQGATKINALALQLAPILKERDIAIIHQTGAKHLEEIRQKYKELGIEADVFGFSDKLQEKIAKADFAVARSGAGTLFELSAHRLPAFFVPYPHAAGNHQEFNAKYLADKGAGFYKKECEATAEEILEIISSPDKIRTASTALKNVIEAGGAKQIIDFIL